MLLIVFSTAGFGQKNVPLGIHYQAVARDNFGNELVNTKISVKFSIISEDPLSAPVYQELHQVVTTSKFGVFSIVIGRGVPTGNSPCTSLSDIEWGMANHYLKVEVKFGNEFMDMGTMQFLAVPYALYAQKSLEPGPVGPKGDRGDKGAPGDPASDDQNLSVINIDGADYLAISGGNQVKVASIEKDGDPANEIQDLTISSNKLKITNNALATEWDLTPYLDNTDRQALSWDPANRILSIEGSTGTVNLSELKNDADANPSNEIQDLQLTGTTLKITGKTDAAPINLAPYLDNTDNQELEYNESTRSLSIDGGNSITLGTMVAFRATKVSSETKTLYMTDYDFVANNEEYDTNSNYDNTTGVFTATQSGIYTFNVGYTATGSGDSRILKIYLNELPFEILNGGITGGLSLLRTITIKLVTGDRVKPIINVGTGLETGTGSFSGYKVN
jgi:hypothetical protein